MAVAAATCSDSISIHALREEGDIGFACVLERLLISIHALREEGDSAFTAKMSDSDDFYPRPPRGGRRDAVVPYRAFVHISIHALREEGDGRPQSCRSALV